MIKAVIVDDEKPSREVLRNYIRDYCRNVEVTGVAGSVRTGYRAINKLKPGLVFLDIELSDGTGFDLLKKFESIDFKVIFVTAFSEYAVKAFRCNAVDYLLKPVMIDELVEACRKATAELTDKTDGKYGISEILKSIKPDDIAQPTLVIPNINGFDVLKTKDIILCRADGYCTNFHLTGGRKVISSKNLKYYEELLCGRDFIRVHNSFIVNLQHVCRWSRQGEIFLSEGLSASLGDKYRQDFINHLLNGVK